MRALEILVLIAIYIVALDISAALRIRGGLRPDGLINVVTASVPILIYLAIRLVIYLKREKK